MPESNSTQYIHQSKAYGALADMYQNAGQDIVVRDYALQHLGHLREDGGDQELITATLYSAASQKNGPLAGTALLSLVQNGEVHDPQQRETTTRLALQAASNPEMDLRSRISAIQVAGRWNDPASLTLATEIALSEASPIPLRLAAIATIGASGEANKHRSLLQSLSNSGDSPRLQQAAQAAIKSAQAATNE